MPTKVRTGVSDLDKKLIQQVIELEKKAQSIHDSALQEAEQLPKQADQEAQDLKEHAKVNAQEEARQMISDASVKEECRHIQSQTEEKINRMEMLAKSHFDQAVEYVLKRIAGEA